MHKRLWLSVAMLALGASLLVAAGFARPAASAPKNVRAADAGGTMRVNMSATDVDYSDPALAYGTVSWQIEYATCANLLNYPDKPAPAGSRLIPEVAQGFPRVSNSGKTYTFTIRSGYRFSNGKPVTAAVYAYAINRDLNPAMQSPAAAFIGDIVGAEAVLKGKAKTASGVKVSGNKLTINLTRPAPDFLARIAMPFFCGVPVGTAINPQGLNALPGAGPYYIKSRAVNREIVLERNPYYKGPRPHAIKTFIITVNTNPDQSLLQIKAGQADYDAGTYPTTAFADLAKTYGINKGRFFVNTLVETDYVALNTSRPAFSSVNVRKAANFAIDRPAMLRARGAFAGKRTDQILPPNIAGFRDEKIYPIKGSDYTKAKSLSGGKCGSVTLYAANRGAGPLQAQVFKYNMEHGLGCSVSVKLFQGFQLYTAAGTKGEPFDAALAGWNADYPDPFDFIDILLNGTNIHATNNNNLAYFNNPAYNQKMAAASKLSGTARYQAYGNLDVDITAHQAPWASYDNRNQREFVSKRTKGYLFQSALASADYATFTIG